MFCVVIIISQFIFSYSFTASQLNSEWCASLINFWRGIIAWIPSCNSVFAWSNTVLSFVPVTYTSASVADAFSSLSSSMIKYCFLWSFFLNSSPRSHFSLFITRFNCTILHRIHISLQLIHFSVILSWLAVILLLNISF